MAAVIVASGRKLSSVHMGDPLPHLSVVYSFLGRYALCETPSLRIVNASAATAGSPHLKIAALTRVAVTIFMPASRAGMRRALLGK